MLLVPGGSHGPSTGLEVHGWLRMSDGRAFACPATLSIGLQLLLSGITSS